MNWDLFRYEWLDLHDLSVKDMESKQYHGFNCRSRRGDGWPCDCRFSPEKTQLTLF